MEYKNYWGVSDEFQNNLEYTDNIFKILEEQNKYLYQYTNGKVFSVFNEMYVDSTTHVMTENISNMFKSISPLTRLSENATELSTNNLIDANYMYFNKRYSFEICTEEYKYRLFELIMTPLYPVEIIVDEGICKNIGDSLSSIAKPMEKDNHFEIKDEETFCNVLQCVLQDKKVRYIIVELQKCVLKKKEVLPEKVIICEGPTDEIILQAIAKKLQNKVTIVVAHGKSNVPAIFTQIKRRNPQANILIIVDSDGNQVESEEMIINQICLDDCELAIINNQIEDWFLSDVANFSKLKLIQSIDEILEGIDFEKLGQEHQSFAQLVDFLRK